MLDSIRDFICSENELKFAAQGNHLEECTQFQSLWALTNQITTIFLCLNTFKIFSIFIAEPKNNNNCIPTHT